MPRSIRKLGRPARRPRGKLIGINSAGALAALAENVGFAIAIDGAMEVAKDIIADSPSCGAGGSSGGGLARGRRADRSGGRARAAARGRSRPLLPEEPGAWLGAAVADGDEGALLAKVVPGSPAEEAGLEPGDVVVGIDGEAVAGAEDLVNAVAGHEPAIG